MQLDEISVRNFRSIKSQQGRESIKLDGLDCLVGKNNAGKTNILSAIRFLLGEDEKDSDEELYWNFDKECTVEVRGFFEVTEEDLARIEDNEKRSQVQNSLIDRGEHEGQLGVCRIEDSDGSQKAKLRLLAFRPEEDRLSTDTLCDYRDSRWENKQDDSRSYDGEQYAADMREEYDEVAELVPSSKYTQKNIWVEKLEEYIESNPEDVEFSLQPTTFKSGTKSLIRDRILPDVISIPALKEVSSTTNRNGVFGNIIQQIQSEIQDELDKQLKEETSGFSPREHDTVDQIENQISSYLARTFEEQSVKFKFPNLSTEYIFKNADIKIQEQHLDEISKENVGEGVKRTVIFSLLRTLADLRSGRLELGEEETEVNSPPFLVLYEEAELFLHPSLQQRLLGVLRDLSEEDSQVVFSTHSPMLIQHKALDTINIVRKGAENGSTVTQFHRVLEEFTDDDAERERLTQMERVSSYIFADTVVLVEGVSDRIFLEKVTPHLEPDWDFDSRSIPVLDVGGKTDVRMFLEFLERLDISAHAVFDIDAIEDEIPKLVESDQLADSIEEFRERVADEAVDPDYSVERLENHLQHMPWDSDDHEDVFERLEEMVERIQAGEELDGDDSGILQRILAKAEKTTPANEDYANSQFHEQRIEIVEQLLDRNVLLLSGEIEDYFPTEYGHSRKHQNAILYDPTEDEEVESPTDRFEECENHDGTDVEVFLNSVFS